jgi:hypothetical protein
MRLRGMGGLGVDGIEQSLIRGATVTIHIVLSRQFMPSKIGVRVQEGEENQQQWACLGPQPPPRVQKTRALVQSRDGCVSRVE